MSLRPWLSAIVVLASCARYSNLEPPEEPPLVADAGGSSGTAPSSDAAGAIDGADLPQGYAAHVRGHGPLSYWRFGGSDAVAHDEMEIAPGTWVGNFSMGARGALVDDQDTAANLTGTGNMHAGDHHDLAQNSQMTIEVWVRFRAPIATEHQPTFVQKGKETDGAGWSFFGWMDVHGPTLRFDRQINWDDRTFCLFGVRSPADAGQTDFDQDNAYHHLVATYDPADAVTRLYVDGVQRQECRHERQLLMPDTPAEIQVGAFLDGQVDEVAVYDQALTGADVASHFLLGHGL